MEMLAIYFAFADNQHQINRIVGRQRKKKHLIVNVRSDSKTSVEQPQGISGIRDKVLQKIYMAIKKLSEKMIYMIIIFNHLERERNLQACCSIRGREKRKKRS
jgi:hypothetical protein